jgi:hypothetical protein
MFVQLTKDSLGRKAGDRLDVSDADGRELIHSGAAVALGDDALTAAVNRAVDGALSRCTQQLDTLINQSLRSFADAQSQSRRAAVPVLFGPGGDGDPKKSFGDWCLAVARNDRQYLDPK